MSGILCASIIHRYPWVNYLADESGLRVGWGAVRTKMQRQCQVQANPMHTNSVRCTKLNSPSASRQTNPIHTKSTMEGTVMMPSPEMSCVLTPPQITRVCDGACVRQTEFSRVKSEQRNQRDRAGSAVFTDDDNRGGECATLHDRK
jgi:hypothetical protein